MQIQLIDNPKLGISLGHDTYKIRLSVKSKNKGKSGGLRVISHLETEIIGITHDDGETICVILIAIYNKSETASISDQELKDLINSSRLK